MVLLGKARGSKNGNNLLIQLIQKTSGVDFGRPYPLPRQLPRPLHQEPLADGDIFAVHHPDLPRKALGGDARALVGARQLVGQGEKTRLVWRKNPSPTRHIRL